MNPWRTTQGLYLTILPLTSGPACCLLWFWWYLLNSWRQRVAARIIPQHALPGLVIPTGMLHSPPHFPSIWQFYKGMCRSVYEDNLQMNGWQCAIEDETCERLGDYTEYFRQWFHLENCKKHVYRFNFKYSKNGICVFF